MPLLSCSPLSSQVRKKMNAMDNAKEGRATDMLLNYETVKYFCNEGFELGLYGKAIDKYQVP
jgi:ABC-type transport system involved in Fe-S cluster assembly fused permease/ATPase subunit